VAEPTAIEKPRGVASRWRGLGLSLRTIVLVLLAVLIYVYGWRATKIDVYQLVTGLPNMRHILAGLLQPDLFVQATNTVAVEAPLRVGAGPKDASEGSEAGARVVVTPASVQPGEQMVFEGAGFTPNADGRLLLGHQTARPRLITQIRTDATGAFHEAFAWPSFAEDDYYVRVEIQSALNRWGPSEALSLSLEKIVETVLLALMGTSMGVLLSVPLSFLGARNLMRGSPAAVAIYYLVRTFFNITRSIEVLIIAVIMAVVVGIGPFAGVMALVFHSIGAMGKLYSEAIESIDHGPIEAITATGATRLQVVRYAVIPQVIPQFVSFTMYRWDINVRMSTVIGLVGGGGIGYLLIQYINLLQWRQAGTAIWLIAAVVMAMDYASAVMRERIV
jgi:phosphonate transport system permease protein